MRITRIDIQGHPQNPGNYATIQRKHDLRKSDHIEVTILTPDIPDGRTHHVQTDCDEDLWSMAEALQEMLDGHRGTHSMIHDYYRQLQTFAD